MHCTAPDVQLSAAVPHSDAAAAVPQAWTIRIQHGLLAVLQDLQHLAAQLTGLQHLFAQLHAWCVAFSCGCSCLAEQLLGPRFRRPRTVILVLLASSACFQTGRTMYRCM